MVVLRFSGIYHLFPGCAGVGYAGFSALAVLLHSTMRCEVPAELIFQKQLPY